MFSGGGATSGGGSSMLLMLVALFVIMYFLMIRPQRKEQKQLQEMLGAMEVGDAVMTSSGFYGIIIDISEDDVIVEFGNNKNCRIPMRKEAITKVEKPGQATAPAAEKSAPKKKRFLGAAKEDAAAAKETAEEAVKDATGEKKE
ncbi:MAG: preprotein translocase subunit YajC [Eubacterium sp.]|nr:preprotein translocase subunit YajC [Eubacterium sp.]